MKAALVIAAVLLVGALFAVDRAEDRASRAEGRVQVFDSLRQVAEAKARADSLGLERAKASFLADSIRLARDRNQERQRGVAAARAGRVAVDSLRATLDSTQAALLVRVEEHHAEEIAAKDAELATADSTAANLARLLRSTEAALASERAARQADAPLIGALREQVAALESAQRRSKAELWITRGGVVLALLAR